MRKGQKCPPETVARIRRAARRQWCSVANRQKMSEIIRLRAQHPTPAMITGHAKTAAANRGQRRSPEQRERYRLAALKRSQNPLYLQKLSEANTRRAADPTSAMLAFRQRFDLAARTVAAAKTWTTRRRRGTDRPTMATRQKIGAAMRAQYASGMRVSPMKRPEIAAKVGAAQRGKVLSLEHRQRMSVAAKARFAAGLQIPPMHYPGAREKLSAFWRGRPKSREQRAKMSVAVKAAHAEGRAALGWLYLGRMSRGEQRLAERLHVWGFRSQHSFAIGPSVRYRIDFAHVALKLAIEIDGESHADLAQIAKDRVRDKRLRTRGWSVLRIPETLAAEHPEAALRLIEKRMKDRSHD